MRVRRGRPPLPRDLVLAAADRVFAGADAPRSVSMDDIAVAAGVGKGTLFRAFGSRDGLLDALLADRIAPVRGAVENGGSPLGPGTPPRERVLAILDLFLTWKLENRHLVRAREIAGVGLLTSTPYKWVHETLRSLIAQSGVGAETHAAYAAHVLLGALRIELLDELLATGASLEQIHRDQAIIVGRVLDAKS